MRWLPALLLLAACSEPVRIVALIPDLPDSTSHLGVLLLSIEGEVVLSTGLFSRTEISAQPPLGEGAEFDEVLVVGFDSGQLEPTQLPDPAVLFGAPLRFADETEPALPTPAYVARGAPSTEVPLARSTIDGALTAAWIRACARSACARYSFGALRELRVTGEVREPSRSSVRLPGGRGALFFHGESDTPVYRFTPPDRIDVLTSSITGPRLRGARMLADGRVALLQENGRLWIGTQDGGFARQENSRPGMMARALAVSRSGDPMEIYAQDTFSNVHVLTATAWTRVHDAGLPAAESQDLEWVGPGELVYVAPEANRLMQFDRGGILRSEDVAELRTLVFAPGWGPLISAGEVDQAQKPSLLVWEATGLRPLPAGLTRRAPLAVWPTGANEEILFGGSSGEVTYFSEALGRCEFERYTSGGLRSVVMLESGILILPGRKDDNDYPGDTKIMFVPFAAPPLASCEDNYRTISPGD